MKIRGETWSLVFSNRMKCYGDCCYPKRRIRINVRKRKRTVIRTLIHEALHASLGPSVTEKEILQIERDVWAVIREGIL